MVPAANAGQGNPKPQNALWFLILIGWVALYGPTYWDLSTTIWRRDEQSHGVIILLVVAWLIWDKRLTVIRQLPAPMTLAGGLLFGLGLLLYVIGRSQDILLFEVGSQIPVLVGALLFLHSRNVVHALWFPIFYLAFMVPLPGVLVDSITNPLKQWISLISEDLLYGAGYPIARSGVTLSIGQYQLLVADACSGLHSMFSLSALGLLYLHLTHKNSRLRNILIFISIFPIAFIANIARVIFLILITYYLGDEAGQGFLHGIAGLVLFIFALGLLVAFDSFLVRIINRNQKVEVFDVAKSGLATLSPNCNKTSTDCPPIANKVKRLVDHTGKLSLKHIAFGLLVLAAVTLAITLKPKSIPTTEHLDLEVLIPKQFGNWIIDPAVLPIIPNLGTQQQISETYDQLVNRTYVNGTNRIMVSIAYGSRQDQKLKIHRQEVCYASQGFEVRNLKHVSVAVSGQNIVVTRMLAVAKQREEPVTYWFTVGNHVVQSHLQRLVTQLQYGLTGTIPDGVLVRISSLNSNEQAAYQDHLDFVNEMFASMPSKAKVRFVGNTNSLTLSK